MTRALLVITAVALCACSSLVIEEELVPCREVVSFPQSGNEATLTLDDATDCECFVDPPSADIVSTFDADACECAGVFVGPNPGRLRLEGECER